MKRRSLLLLVVAIFLSACATPGLATPAPTPEAIHVYYPPSMKYWADRFASCASSNPLIAAYVFPTYLFTEIRDDMVIFSFGQADPGYDKAYLSQVGWDQVVVVVNEANQISQLSTERIRQIFSGIVSDWTVGTDQPIQVWVLPGNDPFRKTFDEIILPSTPLTSEAVLAPDVDAMLKTISQNPAAIGYLPESALHINEGKETHKIKIIPLANTIATKLKQPVIAITQAEPMGLLRESLVCLQDSEK